MSNKNEVKALLARSGVEINNALKRVDHMPDHEVADLAKMAGSLKAFFDKNGSCGAANIADLRAFFDKNGSCSGHSQDLEAALVNVLKR